MEGLWRIEILIACDGNIVYIAYIFYCVFEGIMNQHRVKWKFKQMEVGEKIAVDDLQGFSVSEVQRKVHSYAHPRGKKFETYRIDDLLIVERVE